MSNPIPDIPAKGDGLLARWGEAVVRALRARTVYAGPGLRARQTPNGTVLSLDARNHGASASTPRLFQVSVKPYTPPGGTTASRIQIRTFLGTSATAIDRAVMLNGMHDVMDEDLAILMGVDGWATLGHGDPAEDFCVWLVFHLQTSDTPEYGTGGPSTASLVKWTLDIQYGEHALDRPDGFAPTADTTDEDNVFYRRALHAIPVAYYNGGTRKILQIHEGAMDVSIEVPDDADRSETPGQTSHSIEWNGLDGALQLFGFKDPYMGAGSDPTVILRDAWDDERESAFLLRVESQEKSPRGSNCPALVYCGVSTLVSYLLDILKDEMATPTGGGEGEWPWDLDCTQVPGPGGGQAEANVVVFDPCQGEWINLSAADNNQNADKTLRALARLIASVLTGFWKSGDGAATCYGSSIGNSARSTVADLDNRVLVGEWKADALNVSAAVGGVGGFRIGGVLYAPKTITYVDGNGTSHTETVLAAT